MKRKNLILKILGWTSIIIGGLLNFAVFFLGAYPSYLFFILMAVGLILILILMGTLSNSISPVFQISITLTPFIVFYIIHIVNRPSQDTFLIPDNLRGIVYVYYDQLNGVPEEVEGSRRIYKIPSDGILLTKFNLKSGIIDRSGSKYFLVDRNNNRKELKQCSVHDKSIDSTQVQIINGVCGKSSKYGSYQTFYIDYPTKKFFSKEVSMHDELRHDSIMNLKSSH